MKILMQNKSGYRFIDTLNNFSNQFIEIKKKSNSPHPIKTRNKLTIQNSNQDRNNYVFESFV